MAVGPSPSTIGAALRAIADPVVGGIIGVIITLAVVYIWLRRSGRLDRRERSASEQSSAEVRSASERATVEAAGQAHEILESAVGASVVVLERMIESLNRVVTDLRSEANSLRADVEEERRQRHKAEERAADLAVRLRSAEAAHENVHLDLIDHLRRFRSEVDWSDRRASELQQQAKARADVAENLQRSGFDLHADARGSVVPPPRRVEEDSA